MAEPFTTGAASWVGLTAPDLADAARFYRGLLGWNIDRRETPMGEQLIGSAGEVEIGGMMLPDGDEGDGPFSWTLFLTVSDVDATAAAVLAAGGSVVGEPFDVPDARVALVADPAGATFALTSRRSEQEPWLSRTRPGSVCWIELMTTDTAAAEAFYATVFGWKAEAQHYDGMVYTRFATNGQAFGGMILMPDEVPVEMPAAWVIYFAVDDCSEAERRAVELGGTVVRSTAQVDEGRFAVLADPAGAVFQVMDEHTD